MKLFLLVIVALLVIAAPLTLFFASAPTVISVSPQLSAIGLSTPVQVHVENPHGIRYVAVSIEQDGKTYTARTAQAPMKRIVFSGHEAPRDVNVTVGKDIDPSLHDGKARVSFAATGNDFRGVTASKSFDVDVITGPPRVVADGVQHYINQGGSEMVTFTPSGSWNAAGAKVGDYTFRSFPLPNHPGQYFSLFAFFWQLPADAPVYVYASNPSGAMAKASFWYKIFPKQFRSSTIRLEEMNLDRVVNQIDPEHKIPGDLVQRFVYINSQMRKQNNKTLADLRFQTANEFLWKGAFLPMVDSTVESRFADRRSYTWQGKKVDEQTHLGFDLAKLAHSPIPASNDGRVLFAENLGIYGNCVVIDHGYGLQTIYGHLSEFLVKKGDMVKKGQIIGKTGATGLAGGDHLHFTMQVDGVQVNAVEWWDPHWVKDRILSKLGEQMTDSPETMAGGYPTPTRHARRHR